MGELNSIHIRLYNEEGITIYGNEVELIDIDALPGYSGSRENTATSYELARHVFLKLRLPEDANPELLESRMRLLGIEYLTIVEDGEEVRDVRVPIRVREGDVNELQTTILVDDVLYVFVGEVDKWNELKTTYGIW